MKLKQFLDEQAKGSPIKMLDTLKQMIELGSIEQYLNAVYGIELDIEVKPVKPREGRWYGKGILENLF